MHCLVTRKAVEERAEVIRYLADQGAPLDNIQYQDKKSFRWRSGFLLGTPLFLACKSKDYVSARVLLELGTDLDKRCKRFGRAVCLSPREVLIQDGVSLLSLEAQDMPTTGKSTQ